MPANPILLQTLLRIMKQDNPPSYMLNKSFDVYKFAQSLFQDIENKRSGVTALTREQSNELAKNNLQFSKVRHESRINALYRLIGLPSDTELGDKFNLLDKNDDQLDTKDKLARALLQREYEQLKVTFSRYLTANGAQELNAQAESTQASTQQLISQLFDPKQINTKRLFPVVQYSQIRNVVEANNRIAPSFATTEERYVNSILTIPPFLESVITIRLLQQSGGAQINTQGAVEDVILQSLGNALGDLAKQYHRNQVEAENQLKDGITKIRGQIQGVDSPATKKAEPDANFREPNSPKTEMDVRSDYTQAQLKLYDAIISLLPVETDVIPIGTTIDGAPFQSRSIKENALTSSFLSIVNSNADAIRRSIAKTDKNLQKRKLTQDKLIAELNSSISNIGGISLADILIVISALFVLDEQDLVGLISDSRFKNLIGAKNNNTTASSGNISDSGQTNTPQKQINIYEILKQFENNKTTTPKAVEILQNTIESIYIGFKGQLERAHMLE